MIHLAYISPHKFKNGLGHSQLLEYFLVFGSGAEHTIGYDGYFEFQIHNTNYCNFDDCFIQQAFHLLLSKRLWQFIAVELVDIDYWGYKVDCAIFFFNYHHWWQCVLIGIEGFSWYIDCWSMNGYHSRLDLCVHRFWLERNGGRLNNFVVVGCNYCWLGLSQ